MSFSKFYQVVVKFLFFEIVKYSAIIAGSLESAYWFLFRGS